MSDIPEANPSTASDRQFDLLGLTIGNLASVNLGATNQPVVNFNLGQGNNHVALDLGISGALQIGVLSSYTIIIERFQGGTWVRPNDLGNQVHNGILDLDLLGLGGTHGTVVLDDIPAGTYRATLVPDQGISIGVALTRDISVVATDLTEQVTISVGEKATGNFIDSAATGAVDDLRVGSVNFEGHAHAMVNGTLTVDGDYGTLVIHADGSYTYTPDTGAAAGGTDSFSVTVYDPDTGNALSANLNIDVDVHDASSVMSLSSSDTVSLAFADADAAGGSHAALAQDDSTSHRAIGDGHTGNGEDTATLMPDQGNQEIDLSGLSAVAHETHSADAAPAPAPVETHEIALSTEGLTAAPVVPFEPIKQDDDLATHKLPVV